MKRLKLSIIILMTLMVILASTAIIQAGQLAPTAPPAATMKTLNEIYNKLSDLESKLGQIPPSWSQKIPNAADRFVVVLDGAGVLDKETGLVWFRFPPTVTFSWGDAFGEAFLSPWGGREGWRFPRVDELQSLMDVPHFMCDGNLRLPSGHPFYNLKEPYLYWTSTEDPTDSTRALVVDLRCGPFSRPKSEEYFVWVVRGGSNCNR